MIGVVQGALFGLRVCLVARVLSMGSFVSFAVGVIGVVALVTTAVAWCQGRPDWSWRGCFVGVSYLVVCAMRPGVFDGLLLFGFWLLFALQLSAKWALGRRTTVTGPVFVSVVREWPYNVARHPMTAAEWGIALLLFASAPTVWNGIAFALVSFCNVVAIRFEERFLRRQVAYRIYCFDAPWRVLPGVW